MAPQEALTPRVGEVRPRSTSRRCSDRGYRTNWEQSQKVGTSGRSHPGGKGGGAHVPGGPTRRNTLESAP